MLKAEGDVNAINMQALLSKSSIRSASFLLEIHYDKQFTTVSQQGPDSGSQWDLRMGEVTVSITSWHSPSHESYACDLSIS